MFRLCAILVAATLSACANVERQPAVAPETAAAGRPASVAVPQGLIADQVRVFQVSYPLLRAASDVCTDGTVYGMGLYALNRYTMGAYANVAWRYGIGNDMRVLAAIPDGPAYRAGLMAGDVIMTVNGEPAPTTAASTRAFGLKMAHIARTGTPVAMTVRRGTGTVSVKVRPERLCGYQVQVTDTLQVNARADGRRAIHVTRGMLDFTHSDAELALVIAHEIAHNAMGHLRARSQLMRSMAAAGRVPHGAGANGMMPAFSQALEMEADHMGLYIVARAGMPFEDAPQFIERLAARPGGELRANTHPTSAARVAALRRSVREIEARLAAGQPLQP